MKMFMTTLHDHISNLGHFWALLLFVKQLMAFVCNLIVSLIEFCRLFHHASLSQGLSFLNFSYLSLLFFLFQISHPQVSTFLHKKTQWRFGKVLDNEQTPPTLLLAAAVQQWRIFVFNYAKKIIIMKVIYWESFIYSTLTLMLVINIEDLLKTFFMGKF